MKENNLTDFLTDVADAIREKKGTTDKINPQDFSDEIKSIKTSSSMWTGHVDVEGLKAIGWDDDDIAYFQEHGVNWMEEDDEYYKVSEDNKALYGVLTADNIQEYKDRIVWLPKIEMSNSWNGDGLFKGCGNMIGLPMLNGKLYSSNSMFNKCFALKTIPPFNFTGSYNSNSCFTDCYNLIYLPILTFKIIANLSEIFRNCAVLKKVSMTVLKQVTYSRMFESAGALEEIDSVLLVDSTTTNIFSYTYNLRKFKVEGVSNNFTITYSPLILKDSLLYLLEHEAATSAITITLHEAAYARLATDPDIVAALSEHTFVSLASA